MQVPALGIREPLQNARYSSVGMYFVGLSGPVGPLQVDEATVESHVEVVVLEGTSPAPRCCSTPA